jgi:Ser/Thr protein kinase RdoA (MazF antagonist)
MNDLSVLVEDKLQDEISILTQLLVEQWGINDLTLMALISARENTVFSVDAGNAKYALRVHRAGYHSDETLISELQWMAELERYGVKTPKVIPTKDGNLFKHFNDSDPRQVDLLEWVVGTPLGTIDKGVKESGAGVFENYSMVGSLMARLHNQSESWERPADFTRHSWDIDGLLGDNPLWGRFWEVEGLSANQKDLILRARDRAKTELAEFGKGDDRFGLIHADFLPENLLSGKGGITLIDFDDSGFGWHMFDIATTLFYLVRDRVFSQVLDAFIDGYRVHRMLPDNHLKMLQAFMVVRGLTYLGWAHTRRETIVAREMLPILIVLTCELAEDYLSGNDLL